MNVDILKIFVTVVEQKHFSRAAELLNLSQPGVSMHIRNLENEFGTTLIQRSPNMSKLRTLEIFYTYMQSKCSLFMKMPNKKLMNYITL